MDDSAAILAIGDVHLGTACSGVPQIVSSWGVDPTELTPAAGLKRAAEFAIEQEVHAVLLAGDVVESTNARFEAMAPLEASIRLLVDAGIEVIAVAGNHDVEALPRLASLIDGFTLLGAGGRWESRAVTKNKIPVAEIVGWSFGERFVRQSPVAQLLFGTAGARCRPWYPESGCYMRISTLPEGTTHPLDKPNSTIPVTTPGCSVTFTSHRLKSPSAGAGARPSGYLGSLVGLDPSETGSSRPLAPESSGRRWVALGADPTCADEMGADFDIG